MIEFEVRPEIVGLLAVVKVEQGERSDVGQIISRNGRMEFVCTGAILSELDLRAIADRIRNDQAVASQLWFAETILGY